MQTSSFGGMQSLEYRTMDVGRLPPDTGRAPEDKSILSHKHCRVLEAIEAKRFDFIHKCSIKSLHADTACGCAMRLRQASRARSQSNTSEMYVGRRAPDMDLHPKPKASVVSSHRLCWSWLNVESEYYVESSKHSNMRLSTS